MSQSQWIIITGSTSSGKSTLIEELAKQGHKTVPEMARVVIDEKIAQGESINEIRSDEGLFQKEVFERKLKLEKKLPREERLFFDRGIPDSLAYFTIAGVDPAPYIKFCEPGLYRHVFFLEQLDWDQDYARTETPEQVAQIGTLLKAVYADLGYEVITVPKMSIEERAQFIKKYL